MPHKLLIADDSVTIQRVIELTFADEDIKVFAVGDGRQAIEWLQREMPDIVLADIGMPERDGYEVAAFVKGTPELSKIPVLLLTGAFEPVDEARARTAGCDGVLVKPFEPQMVISRVKDLLAGRQAPTGAGAPSAKGPDFGAGSAAPAMAAPPAPPGSLEDYFDRLDAAFATLEGSGAADRRPELQELPPLHEAERGAADALAGWDPDLAGDPTSPASLEPPASDILLPPPLPPSAAYSEAHPPAPVSPAPKPAAAPPPAPAARVPGLAATTAEAPSDLAGLFVPTTGATPSLAQAFAALLAAEQGQHFSPSTVSPAPAISEAMVEGVVRRVLAQMSDQAVRETVHEVAERLVREEIARIKAHQA